MEVQEILENRIQELLLEADPSEVYLLIKQELRKHDHQNKIIIGEATNPPRASDPETVIIHLQSQMIRIIYNSRVYAVSSQFQKKASE